MGDVKLYHKRYYEKTKHLRQTPEYKETAKAAGFKHRHGISPDDFRAKIVAQNNRCLICYETFVHKALHPYEPVLDHDHACCKADRSCVKCQRGVLHRSCNSALGMLADSPANLRRAADYIEGFKNGLDKT